MKPTRTISSYILLIGLLGLAIVGGILAYQIYSAAVKTQTTAEQKEAIKSIDGAIKQTVVDNLQERKVYTVDEMDDSLLTNNVEETMEVATATAVPTRAVTESATATNSGQL